jgi:hypothetical protein
LKLQILLLHYLIALVWLINGLFCKVLGLVPRHEMIVARILGASVAPKATILIGFLEIGMFFWILSRIRSRWCAWTQIGVVTVMNLLEFVLVPDLLLFGRSNIMFATLFLLLVFWNMQKTE